MPDLLIYDTNKTATWEAPGVLPTLQGFWMALSFGKISKLSYVEAEKIVSLELSGRPCLLILDYAKILMGQLSSEHCTH